jgi:hypothetical protein
MEVYLNHTEDRMSSQESNTRKQSKISGLIDNGRLIVKQHLGIVITILVLILLSFLIHPLWDSLSYNDEGEFAGKPVYYWGRPEGRISLTLHRELDKCGFNDSYVSKFLDYQGPSGQKSFEISSLTGKVISTIYQNYDGSWKIDNFDADEKLISTVHVGEITSGVYEINISCDFK